MRVLFFFLLFKCKDVLVAGKKNVAIDFINVFSFIVLWPRNGLISVECYIFLSIYWNFLYSNLCHSKFNFYEG